MKFTDRKEFLYDSEVFKRSDTQTALKIHAEYVRKHSPTPKPKFLEVDRSKGNIDPLWHMPISDRTQFGREFDMPAINQFEKPDWRLTRMGIVPARRDKFWLANSILQELNYFPERGDAVYFNGYRYVIEKVVLDPSAYWHQTNVWLGLVCECIVPPEGDSRPVPNLSERAPSEKPSTKWP